MGYKQLNPETQIKYLTGAVKKIRASEKIPSGSLIEVIRNQKQVEILGAETSAHVNTLHFSATVM